VVLLAVTAGRPAQAQRQPLPPQVVRDIQALVDEKAARSPAQRKISSHLLHASKMRRGVRIARGIPTLRTGIDVAKDGTTLVDLRTEVTTGVLQRIADLGGSVVNRYPQHRTIRARIPLEQVEALAALPEVRSIRPSERGFTRKVDTTEGDAAHHADQLRSTLGVDGTGVSIGVLSDGVDSLAALQASGDLPPTVTVLPGQAGSGSEGTAMLEIIYDLAPGADLLFATAVGVSPFFMTKQGFAANIIALRDAGANVIVDDVGYFSEAVFQDDVVADAVNTVVSESDVLYFSSAGNSGNFNDGTSGVWEGDFADSGIDMENSRAHDFGSGVIGNEITVDSPFVFTLHWSDALGASANDYDLLLYDSTLTILLAAALDAQNGNDDPYEQISSALWNDQGNRLVIVRFSGSSRYLHLNTNRGRLAIATDGQTSGHSAARDAFSVAAVNVAREPFDPTDPVEFYSSDGRRRVFYEADGTPITPGDFSSTGGEERLKPDLTAADCVSTATPGFSTFCGTSAAAPHAAAVAALLSDLDGSASREQLRDALATTAIDIEGLSWDRDSGHGIVDALAAGQSLTGCGNGDLEAGEQQYRPRRLLLAPVRVRAARYRLR
jgi:subtilisin family serine protease